MESDEDSNAEPEEIPNKEPLEVPEHVEDLQTVQSHFQNVMVAEWYNKPTTKNISDVESDIKKLPVQQRRDWLDLLSGEWNPPSGPAAGQEGLSD